MLVVELFAGLKGWSNPFVERGHEVWTTDVNPLFGCDLTADILGVSAGQIAGALGGRRIDFLLASPPCESFSVASIGTHWAGGKRAYEPRTEAARTAIELVRHTLRLVDGLHPRFALIENPRDVLRKLGVIPSPPTTVWFCHYGVSHAKPTDLYPVGNGFPPAWEAEPQCHNQRAGHGLDCCCRDHESARRGAKTGTQGIKGYALRSLIPPALATSMCLAAEASFIPA